MIFCLGNGVIDCRVEDVFHRLTVQGFLVLAYSDCFHTLRPSESMLNPFKERFFDLSIKSKT